METRYCIEYVNPRHPLRDNGSINVRHDRVSTLKQAEHDLTLILSFGAKILNLYMGNVVDGKTGEWSPIPMIVDDDDWFTTDWLKDLKDRYTWKPSDEQMDALDGICSYIRNKADWEISQDMVSNLYKLSEQLKKLREE